MQALVEKNWSLTTRIILEGYGPEIAALLGSLHRDGSADDVFSIFAEGIWRGVPTFERRCSVRTWAYVIAHRASHQHRRQAKRRSSRTLPLLQDPELVEVEARVRSETLTFLRTEKRSKLLALRDELPVQDQLLLVLRVDRNLAWEDLALIMREGEPVPDSGELKRETARLRKRFQLVKAKIRALAIQAGLIEASS